MAHLTQAEKDAQNLSRQVTNKLSSMCAYGQSKHHDKQIGATKDKIYSFQTFKSYNKAALGFAEWVKEKYGCTDLDEARQYAKEYIQERNDNMILSAYTVKLDASALAKLYGVSSNEFGETRSRERAEITRSRGTSTGDRHFSLSNNAEIIQFCQGTGLRRSELQNLRGTDLNPDKTIHVVGKGGRHRDVPIIGPNREKIIEKIQAAGENRVWDKVPVAMDVHSYRAEYATEYYHSIARPKDEIPREDRYCCRGDLKGVWYDRPAMLEVSQALGHNRESVIAEHYIRA